jgi:hypothetical protein
MWGRLESWPEKASMAGAYVMTLLKIITGLLKQNIFLKIKNASQKIFTNFFVSEVFIKNIIFSMLLMVI